MTLALHDAGLCVLPADPVAKFTTLSTWKPFQATRPTREQVEAWARSARGWCLITGNVSGGLEVIDFDFRAELFEAWQQIVESESPGLVGRLVIERSQSGGKHAFYRSTGIPGNAKLASRVWATKDEHEIEYCGKRLKPSRKGDRWVATACLIETRGQGGLLLCAPTPGYAVEQGDLCDVPTITRRERDILIEAARSLNEAAPEPTYTPAATASADSPGSDFDRRGDVRELLQAHGWTPCGGAPNERWRRPGKNSGCSATLRDINGVPVFYCFSSNADPFDDGRSYTPFGVYAMLEHGGDFRRAKAALQDLGYGSPPPVVRGVDEEEEEEPPTPRRKRTALEDSLLSCPGLIDDVIAHTLSQSYKPNRAAAFVAAVSLMAHLIGRHSCGPGIRTNLYAVIVGEPGCGKDAGRAVNEQILEQIGAGETVTQSIGSAQGLEDALLRTGKVFAQTDEMDAMFAQIALKTPNALALQCALKELWSKSDSTLRRRLLAGQERADTIYRPHFTLFGLSTPDAFFGTLKRGWAADGLLSRLLAFHASPTARPQIPHRAEVPKGIIERATAWWRRRGQGNLTDFVPDPVTVPMSEDARGEFQRVMDATYDLEISLYESGRIVEKHLAPRITEQAARLALLRACSRAEAPEEATIEAPDFEWGSTIARACFDLIATEVNEVDDVVSYQTAVYRSNRERILAVLRESKNGKMSKRNISKSLGVFGAELKSTLDTMVESGEVIRSVAKNTRGPSTEYIEYCPKPS